MTDGVWLEVALNGPWTRQRQPRMPVTRAQLVEEAVACADAGAAIVHVHAYDEGAGRPREAYDLYAPVFEGIRSRRDVVCYPTVPMGAHPSSGPEEARTRYEVVDRLARAGLIEWSVVDPGAVTLATRTELADGADGFLYANSASDVRAGLAVCGEYGLVPSYAVYEPGFLRTGGGSARRGDRRTAAGLPVHVLDRVHLRPPAHRVGAGRLPAPARRRRPRVTLDDRGPGGRAGPAPGRRGGARRPPARGAGGRALRLRHEQRRAGGPGGACGAGGGQGARRRCRDPQDHRRRHTATVDAR